MVERVARAIWGELSLWSRPLEAKPTWDQLSGGNKELGRLLARAAIDAMREPTNDMIMAAMITPSPTVAEAGGVLPQAREHTRLEWQAMIDAALTGPER